MPDVRVIFSVQKPMPNSKVGVSFDHLAGRIFVKTVNPAGLCADSGLQVGHEILSVNGISTSGKTVDDMKTLIKSAESQVLFKVKNEVALVLKVDVKGSSINFTRDEPPEILSKVPKEIWFSIYDSVSSDLLDVLEKADAEDMFVKEMAEYKATQVVSSGLIGFGTESGHEQNVFSMEYRAVTSSTNAVLIASNILAKSNALLNFHGILVQLVLGERTSKIAKQTGIPTTIFPVGLSFSLLSEI